MSVELPTGPWLRTRDAFPALNISRSTLTRIKAFGWFKPGTHYLRTGPGDTSNLLWNIDACRKVMAEMAAPKAGQD
mgnify:CR=1 FL=1